MVKKFLMKMNIIFGFLGQPKASSHSAGQAAPVKMYVVQE